MAKPCSHCRLASSAPACRPSEYDLLSSLPENMMTMASKPLGTHDVAAQNKRVLIVDDDIELSLLYESLLQAQNYQTTTAENGVQALECLRTMEVDAILCDLDMPEMSGDLLYAEVGRTWPGLEKRFLFVTGNAGNPIYEAFLKRTNPKLLSKPVTMDRLLEQLQVVMDSQAGS